MANEYSENNTEAGELAQKVKGSKSGDGADFKSFTNPGGANDEEKSNVNSGGVAHPDDSQKHLPKAGSTK